MVVVVGDEVQQPKVVFTENRLLVEHRPDPFERAPGYVAGRRRVHDERGLRAPAERNADPATGRRNRPVTGKVVEQPRERRTDGHLDYRPVAHGAVPGRCNDDKYIIETNTWFSYQPAARCDILQVKKTQDVVNQGGRRTLNSHDSRVGVKTQDANETDLDGQGTRMGQE